RCACLRRAGGKFFAWAMVPPGGCRGVSMTAHRCHNADYFWLPCTAMLHDLRPLQLLPGAVLVTQEGIIRFANVASAQLLETPDPSVLLGRPYRDFVHPLDLQRSSNRVMQVAEPVQGGQPNKPSEFRIRTLQGNLRMVLISSVAVTWEGAPAVLMCGLDMTHQS